MCQLVRVGIFLLGLVVPLRVMADLQAVQFSSDLMVKAPGWVFGEAKAPVGEDVVSLLAAAKLAQQNGDAKLCMEKGRRAKSKVRLLKPWLLILEMECISQQTLDEKLAFQLKALFSEAVNTPEWFFIGAQRNQLQQIWLKSGLSLLEFAAEKNRSLALEVLNSFERYVNLYADESKADIWKWAGVLARAEDKPEKAIEYFRRSLQAKDSQEVREWVAQETRKIRSQPMISSGSTEIDDVSPGLASEYSEKEQEVFTDLSRAVEKKDSLGVVENAVDLIRHFPGSLQVKAATDRLLEVYYGVADKSDDDSLSLKEKVLKRLLKVDGDRLLDWGRSFFNRGYYGDATKLALEGLDKTQGLRRSKALELVYEAAIASDEFKVARKALVELIEEHAGSTYAREALMRLGILNFREDKWDEAIKNFDLFLSHSSSQGFEIISRYWLWRALQKSNSPRASVEVAKLIELFPFSYYGLRAKIEQAGNALEWKMDSEKIEKMVWLTKPEKESLEKIKVLIRSGWLDEAQLEISELPRPQSPEGKALRALLWAAAAQYVKAASLANSAWDELPSLRRRPLVDSIFPRNYADFIAEQARLKNLDRYLVSGLIKQESGYNARAVSSSNAMGLMQLIPATAREVSGDLKLGPLRIPEDMFRPQQNILMGTYYLSRMVRKYRGHIPLALAAYNAGPGRMDRWLRARTSLQGLADRQTSDPEEEIWMDEIPYWETSVYVKSILRNILLYRLLDQGRVELKDPLWKPLETP